MSPTVYHGQSEQPGAAPAPTSLPDVLDLGAWTVYILVRAGVTQPRKYADRNTITRHGHNMLSYGVAGWVSVYPTPAAANSARQECIELGPQLPVVTPITVQDLRRLPWPFCRIGEARLAVHKIPQYLSLTPAQRAELRPNTEAFARQWD